MDAISAALGRAYGEEVEPWGDFAPGVPYVLGGSEPLDAVRVYACAVPKPHWHMVSFGMSELYEKASADPDESGWGIEFSLRVAREPEDVEPPVWAAVMLQQLAKYVFAQRPFAPGHTIQVARGTFNDRPDQVLDTPTLLTALAFAVDPQLGVIGTAHGRVTFLQVAALTDKEYAVAKGGNAQKVLELIEREVPLHIVDRGRPSVL
ncbi:suppressor of fused domain protein [Streptomyces capparidis]